ncbi:pickpocket protein 28-like isoform X3 [Adelges cooleyi]|uniref:pickpocket protein 28-like isoform X3 n=1 Tax=Adelges cooleyi TaxID=133065 RepID=UPI0021802882|nr:pickpocket protein 28-like isoform X3 [Adelges cooleyi]
MFQDRTGVLNRLSFLDHPLAQIIRKKNLNTWNPEVGFKPDLTPFDTPWRVTGDSVNNRVSLHFKFKRNPGVNCPITGKGFVLIMHNPADAPISLQPTAYISGNRRVAVSSIISIWPTAPTIHAWSPKSRNCYFQHEKPLRYFKVYTENNCDIECRINNTIKRCGCSAYYHPRDYDIPICGSASYACMINTPGYSIFNEKFPDSIEDECDCMPACTEVRYEFKVVGMFKNWTNSDENDEMESSRLSLHFEKEAVISIEKTALISFNELLSNTGGILGLFLGCSIISIFEIIYFFVIRLLVDRWNSKKHQRNNNDFSISHKITHPTQ